MMDASPWLEIAFDAARQGGGLQPALPAHRSFSPAASRYLRIRPAPPARARDQWRAIRKAIQGAIDAELSSRPLVKADARAERSAEWLTSPFGEAALQYRNAKKRPSEYTAAM